MLALGLSWACSDSATGSAPVAAPDPPLAGPDIVWVLSPEGITSQCRAEIARARERIQALVAGDLQASTAPAALAAVDAVVADMNDALVAHRLLAHVTEDAAVRDASAECIEALAAFEVERSADPAQSTLAGAARAAARTAADAQLATIYAEAGRRTGAGLEPARRDQVRRLFDELGRLEIAYMQALGEDRAAIEITSDEAASLPPSLVDTLEARPGGFVVPVNWGTREQFLANQASGAARERYYLEFFNLGGRANVERLEQAVVLRHRLAELLGFKSWAAYRLDNKMAKTPERAMALLREIDAALLPRARAEIRTLEKMKAAEGDDTPFAAWDVAYFEEQLARTRYGVDANTVRQYFPLDGFVSAVLDLYGDLLGVTFQPISPARAWAEEVLAYGIRDRGDGTVVGWFYLDLLPRPGKSLHFSEYSLRTGRSLADGGTRLPIAAIIGNGPAAVPGQPALLSHRDAIIFVHELGHLMHDTLSTARYASLYGTRVREDFVEAPSQMFENWMWEPEVLKRVSSHATTGAALPDDLVAKMIQSRHAADGVFWTRQAFFGVVDLELHGAGPEVDTTELWHRLAAELTALPPAPDTIPHAGFAGFMGGYDAGYYGYLWSKVYAQDMYTAFAQHGIGNPETGARFRREVLGPGGTRDPDALIESFLGRPMSPEAFTRELGLSP
ncbi:MAG: M3 family metallopeptidase [Candidatus Sulfomarinibacteraceae bacterium]